MLTPRERAKAAADVVQALTKLAGGRHFGESHLVEAAESLAEALQRLAPAQATQALPAPRSPAGGQPGEPAGDSHVWLLLESENDGAWAGSLQVGGDRPDWDIPKCEWVRYERSSSPSNPSQC